MLWPQSLCLAFRWYSCDNTHQPTQYLWYLCPILRWAKHPWLRFLFWYCHDSSADLITLTYLKKFSSQRFQYFETGTMPLWWVLCRINLPLTHLCNVSFDTQLFWFHHNASFVATSLISFTPKWNPPASIPGASLYLSHRSCTRCHKSWRNPSLSKMCQRFVFVIGHGYHESNDKAATKW